MMTEQGSVRFGGTTIEYHVRRSARRRKTVDITVDGSGVQVAAPQDTPDEEVRAIVRRRAPWILAHAPESLLDASPKRFVSGETLPYLGRNVRMVLEFGDVRSPEVRFDHWRLRITVPWEVPVECRAESIRKAIVAWYRRRAEARMKAKVDQWWPRFSGGKECKVLIRDQRQRWGSCASDGTLRFNWRVVMLEPALAEYVVVHELAHLRVRSHSAEFWALLSWAMPDAQERRRRLREVGKSLPL
jgi:predicted metal-dependent hydrolase